LVELNEQAIALGAEPFAAAAASGASLRVHGIDDELCNHSQPLDGAPPERLAFPSRVLGMIRNRQNRNAGTFRYRRSIW
jgi:hypothetical protein